MCATAIYWAQVGRLVYGASDPKLGFSRHQHIMHPKTQILGGIEEDTCGRFERFL